MVKKGVKLREQVITVAVLFCKMAVSALVLPTVKPPSRKKTMIYKSYTIQSKNLYNNVLIK
jgi:hypothetical protein